MSISNSDSLFFYISQCFVSAGYYVLVIMLKGKCNCSDFSVRLLEFYNSEKKIIAADDILVLHYDLETKL